MFPGEFYWNRFVDPLVFTRGEPPLYDALVPFPAVWKDYAIADVGSVGYCTWHLRLTGLIPDRLYGLRSSSYLSAASIYTNGMLVQTHGVPGKSQAEEKPGWFSKVSSFTSSPEGIVDIVIHASNYADRHGGTRTSLSIGDYDSIAALRERAVAFELFVVGAMAIMGGYYLGLFAFRRKEKAVLWYGLLCVIMALRVMCYDEYYILTLFPSLPWRLLYDLGYLTFTAAVVMFAAFVHETFPHEFPGWAVLSATAVACVYSFIIIFLPTRLSSLGLVWFQLASVVIGLGAAFAILLATRRGRRGAGLFGIGFLAMFAGVIHDILISAGVLHGIFLMQLGMLGLLFALSLILTRRFAEAFSTAEELSGSLVKVNRSLERFVPKQFLGFLKKSSLEEIELGDSSAEEMAVLFADVRSFTAIAESSTPEETFAFINEYLARVGPAVRNHGGFIDKYLGDGFMALFPEGAEAALLCALDIQSRLAEYNAEREADGRLPIQVGIGVHSGHLMLGTIGESLRMDGTVISDAVNLASRLEGVSKEYDLGIAVSERVLADLPDPTAYRMRFIGKVKVKGKSEAVSVFEIYEGDPEELRSRKDLVRASFERGVEAYYERRYGEAKTLFDQVLALLPKDWSLAPLHEVYSE
ncbi:adenylate/guanylate cyclase domain-containing protein [Spirochaetota bacterium]